MVFVLKNTYIFSGRIKLPFCVGTKISVVTVVTRPRAGRPRNCGSITGTDDGFFSFLKRQESLLSVSSFFVQSVPEVMRTGREAGHVYLVPMLRMNGAILIPPPHPLRCSLTYTKDVASRQTN